MYNPIARSVTAELLPCLRHYNISFNAYNLICGGVLSGKYNFNVEPEGTRYDLKTLIGQMARDWYWSKSNFEAVHQLQLVAAAQNLTLLEATLRWMRHHSGLGAKDGILIGSTSVGQLEESLTELEKGPLPEEMVKAFDEAWEAVKGTTNGYFRGPDAPKVAFLQKKE
ncbi:hypothetical protein BGZ47_004125 [Haplosporangium gracile]|nr:hypothetical protein BGZ47_004125 [Haplosporangium gracile]